LQGKCAHCPASVQDEILLNHALRPVSAVHTRDRVQQIPIPVVCCRHSRSSARGGPRVRWRESRRPRLSADLRCGFCVVGQRIHGHPCLPSIPPRFVPTVAALPHWSGWLTFWGRFWTDTPPQPSCLALRHAGRLSCVETIGVAPCQFLRGRRRRFSGSRTGLECISQDGLSPHGRSLAALEIPRLPHYVSDSVVGTCPRGDPS
jgi:hypothetical protein